jgi:hypothetical protein
VALHVFLEVLSEARGGVFFYDFVLDVDLVEQVLGSLVGLLVA